MPTKVKPFQCMECGKALTAKQAEKAAFADGCPKCGGSDVDLAPPRIPNYCRDPEHCNGSCRREIACNH